MIFNCYVSQQQYSWDCDVWHNRHLDLKIRVLTALISSNSENISFVGFLKPKTAENSNWRFGILLIG